MGLAAGIYRSNLRLVIRGAWQWAAGVWLCDCFSVIARPRAERTVRSDVVIMLL
jgi:hypothetical protein